MSATLVAVARRGMFSGIDPVKIKWILASPIVKFTGIAKRLPMSPQLDLTSR
jgi:hypothetical protein